MQSRVALLVLYAVEMVHWGESSLQYHEHQGMWAIMKNVEQDPNIKKHEQPCLVVIHIFYINICNVEDNLLNKRFGFVISKAV